MFDTLSVLLYQYTHALNQCDTKIEGLKIMINILVTVWLSALATGMFMAMVADKPA